MMLDPQIVILIQVFLGYNARVSLVMQLMYFQKEFILIVDFVNQIGLLNFHLIIVRNIG
jgi:hypothetical protein